MNMKSVLQTMLYFRTIFFSIYFNILLSSNFIKKFSSHAVNNILNLDTAKIACLLLCDWGRNTAQTGRSYFFLYEIYWVYQMADWSSDKYTFSSFSCSAQFTGACVSTTKCAIRNAGWSSKISLHNMFHRIVLQEIFASGISSKKSSCIHSSLVAEREQKDVIWYWVDAVPYKWKNYFEGLCHLSKEGVHFCQAYTATPFTFQSFRTCFSGVLPKKYSSLFSSHRAFSI